MSEKIGDTIPNGTEVKLKNRFKVEFPEIFNLKDWHTHKASRPVFNMKGKTWSEICFTLYDTVEPSTSKGVMDGITEIMSLGIDEYIIKMFILGPTNDVIEEWELMGEIVLIDFGILDYSKSEAMGINIHFDVKGVNLKY